ncbi:hypothetical protein D4Q76_02945 [archaeon]|nr:MAG: hypothetical protein D4Q76_02945 [archaeon]
MPIPEKRSRFLQELESKVRERKTAPEAAARAVPAAGYNSEVRNIRNIILKGEKGSAQKPSVSGGAGNFVSVPIGTAGSDCEEIFSCLNRLEERIDMLDAQMKRHFGNSKLVESEIGRLVSDKWESLSKETDECLTRMMGEMQDLRDIVIGLRSSVRSMEK